MSQDKSYGPGVHRRHGGNEMVVAGTGAPNVGTLTIEEGGIVNDQRAINKGVIPIGIFNTRLLTTNAFLNTIEAGTPDGNTNPSLQRVNAATDKQARLAWAASNSDEIQFPSFVYPPDLDDASDIEVHFLAAMAGATDTPVLTVGFFEGVGDTDAGGATSAVTGTTLTEYTRTIAAADVGAHPKVATVTVTPGAHTTDILYLYACWIEYTKKTS